MPVENDGLLAAVSLMALAARTAPKAKGKDSIVTLVLSGDDLGLLSAEMKAFGEKNNLPFFVRDAGSVAASPACLIIGIRGQENVGINCTGCGYDSCTDMIQAVGNRAGQESPFTGPNCILKIADLGIAVGSAVKTASLHNVDNRVMYTAGVAARFLGFIPGCSVAFGIPVSATGKNIFFDRHM